MGKDIPDRNRFRNVNVYTDGNGWELDVVFDALTERRRRDLLYFLSEKEIATLSELVNEMVRWGPYSRNATREDLELRLYHTDLPKLVKAGLIEYDRRTSTILFRDPPEGLETMLECAADLENPAIKNR